MARITFTHVISIGEEEHSCRVTGMFSPGYEASHYGPAPHPGEPDSFDVESVEVPIAIREFGRPTGKFRYLDIIEILTEAQINEIADLGVMAADEDAIEAQERRAEERREDARSLTNFSIAAE